LPTPGYRGIELDLIEAGKDVSLGAAGQTNARVFGVLAGVLPNPKLHNDHGTTLHNPV
jgi:hypothetical protein